MISTALARTHHFLRCNKSSAASTMNISPALSVLALATACQSWSPAPHTAAFQARASPTTPTRGGAAVTVLRSASSAAPATYADPARYLSDHPNNNVLPP